MDKKKEVSLLIKNAAIIPMDGNYFPRGFVAVDDKRIWAAGPMEQCSYTGRREIDGEGCAVLPGMINGHAHMGMGYMRGFADDIDLYEFIDRTFQPVLHSSADAVYCYTLLGAAEMMRSGYTMVADSMYQLSAAIQAITDSGMRGKLCETTVDFHDAGRAEKLIQTADDFYTAFHGSAEGRVTIDFCLHGAYSCSRQLLEGIAEAAAGRDADIQIHVAESRKELADVRTRCGTTPVRYLEELGILRPNVIAAHFVHVDPYEISLAGDRGIRAVHNIASNLKLASGIAPVTQLRSAGIPLALGTDSSVTNNRLDAFDTMRLTALVHKGAAYDATALPAREILELSTIGGARAMGLQDEIGSIEAGKLADLILVRMGGKPNYTPWVRESLENTLSNLVYSGTGEDVETVLINGRVVMENRCFPHIDLEKLTAQAQEIGLKSLRDAGMIR